MIRKRKNNNVRIEPLELDKQVDRAELQFRPRKVDEMASNKKVSSKPRILRKSMSFQEGSIYRDELSPKSPTATAAYDCFTTSGDSKIGDQRHRSGDPSDIVSCKCGLNDIRNRKHSTSGKCRGKTNFRNGSALKKSASFSSGFNRNVMYECTNCEGNNVIEESTPRISKTAKSTPPNHKRNLGLELKVIKV